MVASRGNKILKDRLPGMLARFQSEIGISWYSMCRRLDVPYHHLWEYRKGRRIPPARPMLELVKLASEHDLLDLMIGGLLDECTEQNGAEDGIDVASSSLLSYQARFHGGAQITAARRRVIPGR